MVNVMPRTDYWARHVELNSSVPETYEHRDYHEYSWITGGVASFLLFVILVEWMRPMAQLSAMTNIYVIEPFILAVFGFVALDYLRINAWLVWPLKLLLSLLLISVFYYDNYGFDLFWWGQYAEVTMWDVQLLLTGHASSISGENRTMLLMIGLSMLVYALHSIIVRHQYCGWFIVLTTAYLAVLQAGFGVDTTRGVIVSFCAGLALSILLQPVRWRSKLHDVALTGNTRSARYSNTGTSSNSDDQSNKVRQTNASHDRNTTQNQKSAHHSNHANHSNHTNHSNHANYTNYTNRPHHTRTDRRKDTARAGVRETKNRHQAIRRVTVSSDLDDRSLSGASRRMTALIGSLAIAGIAWLTGYVAAKDQPRTPDPAQWNIHQFVSDVAVFAQGNLSNQTISWTGIAQTGYPLQDYLLGGSVIPANTPVFAASSDIVTYWRGESKAFYDGSGWSDGDQGRESGGYSQHRTRDQGSSNLRDTSLGNSDQLSPDHQHSASHALTRTFPALPHIVQEVTMDRKAAMFLNNMMFTGGEIAHIQEITGAEEGVIDEDRYILHRAMDSGRYSIEIGNQNLASYRVEVTPMLHDALDALTVDERYRFALEQGISQPLDAEELRYYTQLPEEMSQRVYDLASNIVNGIDSDLEKARAIAAYLRKNYTYDLNGPVVPGQEFVDHFLFEQTFGYCDHFSTAMAVMLRMNGIPARWVKGFSPGQWTKDETGRIVSEVRAEHAHSWVEAYFPEIGWVGFEPTPSYAGSLDFGGIVSTGQSGETNVGSQWWQGPVTLLLSQANEEIEQMGGNWMNWLEQKMTAIQEQLTNGQLTNHLTSYLLWIAIGVVIAGTVGLIVWRFRYVLQQRKLKRMIRMMDRRGGMALMLEHLWRDITRKYGPLKTGQTLREYVQTLDLRKGDQREALMELAILYESIRFDERLPERVSQSRMSRLWRVARG